jgi:formylglycine-generating enzyme required for sulfatase activity
MRHAIARALATANRAPTESTFKVLEARVELDGQKRVVRAQATIQVVEPRPVGDWSPRVLQGMVNPDGLHPLMIRVASARPFFMDIFPVTWDRWLRRIDDPLPARIDPQCPRTGVEHAEAQAFAAGLGKRLPSEEEMAGAWGEALYPWGPDSDPRQGRYKPPRFDHLPEVGLYPPGANGLYDLGAWLWHWTAQGTLRGGTIDFRPQKSKPPVPELVPRGFRLVQDG